MNHIGVKIRELRKKNSMTQEKLADFLGMSYQAVSKWECGVACPDLSLIGPLTKILHCTADELLGLTSTDISANKHEEACEKFRDHGNPAESLQLARCAVADHPNEFRYIEWLAYSEYRTALAEYQSGCSAEFLNEMLDNAYRRYNYILDNCTDHEWIRRSALGKFLILYFQDRTEEASWSVEFEYPDPCINTSELLLELSPEGRYLRELLSHER